MSFVTASPKTGKSKLCYSFFCGESDEVLSAAGFDSVFGFAEEDADALPLEVFL